MNKREAKRKASRIVALLILDYLSLELVGDLEGAQISDQARLESALREIESEMDNRGR